MQVDTGRAQGGMPQQQLDTAQVHPRFEQMSGKCMAKQMWINRLFNLSGLTRFFAHKFNATGGDGLADSVSGKEPGLQAIELPVAPQERQQIT